jgi:assimilatory nitrate reductase catalytic subunit
LIPAHVDPHSGQPELKQAAVSIVRFPLRWQGIVVSERELALPRSGYWAASPVAGGWLYWLAGSEPLPAARQWLQALLPGEPDLIFDLEEHGVRSAWLPAGRLGAVLMLAGDEPLPEPWWLAQRLGQALAEPERRVLLSGMPPGPGTADGGAMVCSCFQVSETRIRKAIVAGAATTEQLGEQLRCGTNCGSCVPQLIRMLRDEQRHLSTIPG